MALIKFKYLFYFSPIKYLLYYLPFLNFISVHINNTINLLVVLSFTVFALKKITVKVDILNVLLLTIGSFFILSNSLKLFYYDTFSVQEILTFVTPLLLALIYYNSKIDKDFIVYYTKYLIILIMMTNLYDYIIIYGHFDFAYKFLPREGNSDYIYRPQGIFGQGSITSIFLSMLYLGKIYLEKKLKINVTKINAIVFFLIYLIGILLQLSGSGYVSFLIVIVYYATKKPIITISILIVLLINIAYYIDNINLHKLSLEYILANFHYFDSLMITYTRESNIFNLLFGFESFPVDLGTLYVLSLNGFIYFILLNILFLAMVINSKFDKGFIALISFSFIFSVHYPVVIYSLPFLYLVMLYNVNIRRGVIT